jgi:hypothetical protein
MNWGNAQSLQEIWWHITGRQYRVFFSFSSSTMGPQFVEFCRMALREFGFQWLPLTLFLSVADSRARTSGTARPFGFCCYCARRPGLLIELRNR